MGRNKRASTMVAFGAGAVMAAALAACGSGGASHVSGRKAVETAYHTSLAAKTARFTVVENVSLSAFGSSRSESLTASGEANLATQAVSMNMTTGSLHGTMRLVEKSGYLYVQLPSSLRAMVPGAKSWLGVNVDKLLSSKLSGSMSQLSQLEQAGPNQELAELSAASGHVKRVGSVRIGGVETTEYRGQLVWSKVIARMRSLYGSTYASTMERVGTAAHIKDLPFTVWIDSHGRLARLVTGSPLSLGNSGSGQVTVTVTMFGYGKPVHITAPPAGDVESLSSILSHTAG